MEERIEELKRLCQEGGYACAITTTGEVVVSCHFSIYECPEQAIHCLRKKESRCRELFELPLSSEKIESLLDATDDLMRSIDQIGFPHYLPLAIPLIKAMQRGSGCSDDEIMGAWVAIGEYYLTKSREEEDDEIDA